MSLRYKIHYDNRSQKAFLFESWFAEIYLQKAFLIICMIYIIPKGFATDELIFLVPKTSENYFVYAGSYLVPYDYANVKYIKAIENEEMVKK